MSLLFELVGAWAFGLFVGWFLFYPIEEEELQAAFQPKPKVAVNPLLRAATYTSTPDKEPHQ